MLSSIASLAVRLSFIPEEFKYSEYLEVNSDKEILKSPITAIVESSRF